MATPNPDPDPNPDNQASKPNNGKLETRPTQPPVDSRILRVAVAILAVYLLGLLIMFLTRSANEITWARLVYLFGGLEAIAFAAAGYLFGREVNRARAENAEARADEAQADSVEAKQDAAKANADAEKAMEKGQTLAKFITSRVAPEGDLPGDREAFGPQAGRVSPDDIRAIHDLANQLFP